MNIGARLAAYMAAKGFKQKALESASGVSQSRISEILRGESDPQLSTLEKLAAALGASMNDFMRPEPPADEDLTWFWQERFAKMQPIDMEDLKRDESRRMVWAVQQLATLFSVDELGRRLDLDEEHIRSMVRGDAFPTPALEDLLAQRMKLSLNWLRYGELPPVYAHLRSLLADDAAGDWLAFVDRAIRAGLDPDYFEGQLSLYLHQKAKTKPPE